MNIGKEKIIKKKRRAQRVRAKLLGTGQKPRLSVFRSNLHLYCQLIDDTQGKTVCSVSDKNLPAQGKKKHIKLLAGQELGKLLAKKAEELGIKEIIFDRGAYKYHGRVKAVAEGAREGGLKF